MVDTSRTKSALLTLLADNVSGDISPQDIRDMLVSIFGEYGHMYVKNGAAAQGSVGTSFVKMTGFASDGISDGITVDSTTNNRMTIATAGDYLIFSSFSFSGTANTVFTFNVHVGQAEGILQCDRTIGTGGDTGTTVLGGLLTLAASDQVEIYVKADGASKSLTPVDCHWLMIRVA